MPGDKKFGSAGKSANQYDNFMRRYEGAYEGTTPPDKEVRTEAFNRAVESSSLDDEGKIHNVLKECVFHYISADNSRDKNKNITAFSRVLSHAQNNGLLARAEPEQILTNIIGQLDKAMGRSAEQSAIDESKAKKLIKMGRKLCDAASLEGPNVEFIQELEEVIRRHTQQPQKSVDTHSTTPRREQMGRSIKVR
jgi:hypothetical protein